MLLLLDNLEQVIEVAPQVRQLLANASEPRIFCSSREALRVSGEHEFPVPPLHPELAVQLFVGRARQVRPDWQPSAGELEAVVKICRLLDGLPLAIELAAARIRLFPAQQLLKRLSERLPTLESGVRDAPERQRTLSATIDWSWNLLNPVEQQVFMRLAVFTGGADLAAIEAIIDPSHEVSRDVLTTLTSLVEKSLVVVDQGTTGESRYSTLETIREYAANRFAGSSSERVVRQRHLEFFLELTKDMESQLFMEDPAPALARLEAEHGNIRSAIEWSVESGQPALGFAISAATWRFWQQRGHLSEGRLLLERLLAAPGSESDPVALARGLTAYGGITYWQGDHAATRPAYEKALRLLQNSGHEPLIAMAEYNVGWMHAFARNPEAATELLERGAARYRALGDERGELIATEGLALSALIAGNVERARELAETVVTDAERLGMRFHHADAYSLLAVVYLVIGDAANARRTLVAARDGFYAIGDSSRSASVLELGAALAVAEGRPFDAARLLGAIANLRETGEQFFLPSEVNPLPNPDPRPEIGCRAKTSKRRSTREGAGAWRKPSNTRHPNGRKRKTRRGGASDGDSHIRRAHRGRSLERSESAGRRSRSTCAACSLRRTKPARRAAPAHGMDPVHPSGDLLLVVFETDTPEKLPRAFGDDEYDRWWVDQIQARSRVRSAKPGPPPTPTFAWSSD